MSFRCRYLQKDLQKESRRDTRRGAAWLRAWLLCRRVCNLAASTGQADGTQMRACQLVLLTCFLLWLHSRSGIAFFTVAYPEGLSG